MFDFSVYVFLHILTHHIYIFLSPVAVSYIGGAAPDTKSCCIGLAHRCDQYFCAFQMMSNTKEVGLSRVSTVRKRHALNVETPLLLRDRSPVGGPQKKYTHLTLTKSSGFSSFIL